MKKIVLLAFVVLLLSMSMFGTRLVIAVSSSTTHHVYPGQSIQEAIDSAESGDTIFVHNGTYYENVVVNKNNLTLTGENKDATIIDGGGVGNVVVDIKADNITLSGFTIQNGRYYGILLDGSDSTTIAYNNVINNQYTGIFLGWDSNSNTLFGNNITNNGDAGIDIRCSFDNTLWANDISNGKYGIVIMDSDKSGNVVSSNVLSNNTCNLYLPASSRIVFYHNNLFKKDTQVAGGYENIWDDGYPSGGNYWSDYTGVDVCSGPYQNETGSNGIGDTSYIIDAHTQDNFPLMGMFYDFTVEIEWGRISHVHVVSNSTVSNLEVVWWLTSPNEYLQPGDKFIRFDVAGEERSVGFCRIMIPRVVLNDSYVVLVYWLVEVPFIELPIPNSTHAYLYFTYTQPNELMIVPEFLTWTSMLLILTVLTVAIVIYKRRPLKTPIH